MALDPANWSNVVGFEHDPADVDSDLTNFPAVLVLTSEDLAAAQADGSDFRVTDDGDNVLDYEIERFDQAGDELIVWFRVPTLSSSTAQQFRIYWGNPGAADAQNPAGLWAEYDTVFHFTDLEESGGGGATATKETEDGSASGITHVAGQIGDAVHSPGDPNYLDLGPVPADSVFRNPFTVTFWMKPDDGHSSTNPDMMLNHRHQSGDFASGVLGLMILGESTGSRAGGLQTTYAENDDTVLDEQDGTAFADGVVPWRHTAWVFDIGTAFKLLVDGVEEPTTDRSGTAIGDRVAPTDWQGSSNRDTLALFCEFYHDSQIGTLTIRRFFKGAIDGLRIYPGALSTDWVEVEYANQSAPSIGGFWTTSATTSPPDKPVLTVDESRETGAALSSSAYSDPDGHLHDASRWQIDEDGGDFSSPIYDSGWTGADLESHDTGDGVYPSGDDYIARVAHRDSTGAFTWSDPVALTAPDLPQLSTVEGLFFGQSGGNNLWEFGGHHLDLQQAITARMRTAPLGPGGVGGEALFHNLYLALEWQSQGTVVVTPILDGDRRADLSRTIDLAAKLEPTRDRFEIPLVYGFEDGGVEVLRQALRGTWFQADLEVTLERPSVHGIMVEGIELEHEVVRESHPAISYEIESLEDVDHEQAVPWYVGASGELLEGDVGVTDDGAGITARIQTSEVAPAGPGGEAAFHNAYLALTRSNPVDATLTLTPIVDGVDQDARNLTLSGVAGPVTEVLEVPLTQGFDVGGVEELRYALRGAFFSLRLEASVPDGALVFEGLELETEIVREGEAAVAG